MTFNPAEIEMLRSSLANLEYLIEKVPEPDVRRSFMEQRNRCQDRLAELEAQKAAS